MTIKYKPTLKHRCEDVMCKYCGQPLVDKGWGYPVCLSNKWRHEIFPNTGDIPMNSTYLSAGTN